MLSSEALGLIVQLCFFAGLAISCGVLLPFSVFFFFKRKSIKRGVNSGGFSEVKKTRR